MNEVYNRYNQYQKLLIGYREFTLRWMEYLELLAVQNMSKLNVQNLMMIKISCAQNTV